MTSDFDSIIKRRWETSLPEIPIKPNSRREGFRSKPSTPFNTGLFTVIDYQRNIKVKFEKGIENELVGHNVNSLRGKGKNKVDYGGEYYGFGYGDPNRSGNEGADFEAGMTAYSYQTGKSYKIDDNLEHNDFGDSFAELRKAAAIQRQVKVVKERPVVTNDYQRPTPPNNRYSVNSSNQKQKLMDDLFDPDEFTLTSKRVSIVDPPPVSLREKIRKSLKPRMIPSTGDKGGGYINQEFRRLDRRMSIQEDIYARVYKETEEGYEMPNINRFALENNPDDFENIMMMVPEMKRLQLMSDRNGGIVDSILMYNQGAQVFLPDSYKRLIASQIKVPRRVLVPVGKRKNAFVPEVVEEFIEDDSARLFFADFEMLLDRQVHLHTMQLSMVSSMETKTQMRDIARYPVEDLLKLVWHQYAHLKVMGDELIPDAVSTCIYDILHDGVLTPEEQVADITNLIINMTRKGFIYLKAFTGHLKRFDVTYFHTRTIGVCSEGIGGPERLCSGLANIFASLIFKKPMPMTNDVYIAPILQIRKIVIEEDEEEERERKEKARLAAIWDDEDDIVIAPKPTVIEKETKPIVPDLATKDTTIASDSNTANSNKEENESKTTENEEYPDDFIPMDANDGAGGDMTDGVKNSKPDLSNEANEDDESSSQNSSSSSLNSLDENKADNDGDHIEDGEKGDIQAESNENEEYDDEDDEEDEEIPKPGAGPRKPSIFAFRGNPPEIDAVKTTKNQENCELFGWDEITEEDLKFHLLEQETPLTAFGAGLEIILKNWDKMFLNEQGGRRRRRNA
ncbi:hypothetical protein BC833DRAFT_618007 [Globomyces pollinis-pini]|nr:hypothetical protein BC833DRAFT_618007 [Globomyces pollinis-pini]